jgi:hypothetical protein
MDAKADHQSFIATLIHDGWSTAGVATASKRRAIRPIDTRKVDSFRRLEFPLIGERAPGWRGF